MQPKKNKNLRLQAKKPRRKRKKLKRKLIKIRKMLRRSSKPPMPRQKRLRKRRRKLIKPRKQLKKLRQKCGHQPRSKPRWNPKEVLERQLPNRQPFNKRPKIRNKVQLWPSRRPRKLRKKRKPVIEP